jgi:hypothetical protein
MKIIQHHLTRIVGEALSTFDGFVQVEAIYNSRPLTPLGEDPDDSTALTAGHLLVCRPLVPKSAHDFANSSINQLTRLLRTPLMQQHFWHRCSQEYLHQLPFHTKYDQDITPVVVGQLVFLEVEIQPPTSWPLGKILDCLTA